MADLDYTQLATVWPSLPELLLKEFIQDFLSAKSYHPVLSATP